MRSKNKAIDWATKDLPLVRKYRNRRLTEDSKQFTVVRNPYQVPESYAEFLSECCRIRSGNKIIPFLPFEYQVELSRLIDLHRGAMVFKTRQMGATEAIAGKFLHKALLNPAYAAAVLSIGQAESSNVAVRIQNMPSKVSGLEFGTKSKTEVQPKGCGKIWFRPSTDDAARSLESISDLFFDEAAFPDNFEEIYSSSAPTQEAVGDDARTIIASTMSESGKLCRFWQMFEMDNPCDAEEMVVRVKDGREEPFTYWTDNSGWIKIILHWRSHPVYSSVPKYLEHTKKKHKLTEDKLQREYNLGIPSAGGSLFQPDAIARCAIGQWEQPTPGNRYLLGIDPNFGGKDFWEAQVWDITSVPYKLVAEFREQERATGYCLDRTALLIDIYEPIINVIESNSGGVAIAEQLLNLRPDIRLETVSTTRPSKIQNTDRIALTIEEGQVIYPPDWVGTQEMRNFSSKERCAMSGHDDAVMCWAIAFAWLEEALVAVKAGKFEGSLGTVVQRKSRFRQ
jgi:hypothetical protein